MASYKELAELILEKIKCRTDVVAERYVSKNGKTGYSPICKNKFKKNLCAILTNNRCKNCKNQDYQELTLNLLIKHLKGQLTLGVYPMLPDNTVNFIVCDLDNNEGKDPYNDLLAITACLETWDLDFYVLKSRSGEGFHVYFFFDNPVPAFKARLVFDAVISESQIDDKFSTFDRFIPNQDELSKKNLGNLIALPFQFKPAQQRYTLFLTKQSQFKEIAEDQAQILKNLVCVSEKHLDEIIKTYRLAKKTLPKYEKNKFRIDREENYPESDGNKIIEKCSFLQHCKNDAISLPENEWYLMISILSRCKDAENLIHHLSQEYPKYTLQETNEKILHAREGSKPVTCVHIKKETRNKFCHECEENVNSPIALGMEYKKDDDADCEIALKRINEEFACVLIGGKFRVMREKNDPNFNRPILEFLQKGHFKDFFENDRYNVRVSPKHTINKSLGDLWLEWPNRRQYSDVTFKPKPISQFNGNNISSNVFNLYRGFTITPQNGDWTLFKYHIQEIICDGNPLLFSYTLAWMARIVQSPGGVRPGVALVLRGERGTGKGTFVENFGSLFGTHFYQLADSDKLTGKFNAHLINVILLFADEAFFAGDRRKQGVLQAIITQNELAVELKGIDSFSILSHINLVMASNNDWVIPAGTKERRYCVLDVSDKKIKDFDYWKKLDYQMKHGGREAMLFDLLEMDIKNINLRDVPNTSGLQEQIVFSLESVDSFWMEILKRGYMLELPEDKEEDYSYLPQDQIWEFEADIENFYDQYCAFCEQTKDRYPYSNARFGVRLKQLCPEMKRLRRTEGRRKWYYRFPDLPQCRQNFENKTMLKLFPSP